MQRKKTIEKLTTKKLTTTKNLTSINSFTEFKPHGAWTFNDSLYYNS